MLGYKKGYKSGNICGNTKRYNVHRSSYYILGDIIKYKENLYHHMENQKILIDVEKFKELLIFGWHLLPAEKQRELIEIGIYPGKVTPSN